MTDEKALEAVLEQLEFTGESREEKKGITFWVTLEEHETYMGWQRKSSKRFGKSFEALLRKILQTRKDAA